MALSAPAPCFHPCAKEGRGSPSRAFRASGSVLPEAVSLGVGASHPGGFPQFLTTSSPRPVVWGWQSLEMLQLGVRVQRPRCPLPTPWPRQGSLLTLRTSAAFGYFVVHQEGRREQEGALKLSGPPATHHIGHFEASEREDDGIGWGGHRQHEGQGGGQRAGKHDIERVEADGLRLDGEIVGRTDLSPHPGEEDAAPNSPTSPLWKTTSLPTTYALVMNPPLLPEGTG